MLVSRATITVAAEARVGRCAKSDHFATFSRELQARCGLRPKTKTLALDVIEGAASLDSGATRWKLFSARTPCTEAGEKGGGDQTNASA